jgi:hypothetical protein
MLHAAIENVASVLARGTKMHEGASAFMYTIKYMKLAKHGQILEAF